MADSTHLLDACLQQLDHLLSLRWWSHTVDGGISEILALRCLKKGAQWSCWSHIARVNGCHLPSDDEILAKKQMRFVCFDAAVERAVRELKGVFTVCGGYALSRLMRTTTPYNRYKFVANLSTCTSSNDVDVEDPWGWGDVDFFLTSDVQRTRKGLRRMAKRATRVIMRSFTIVAASMSFKGTLRTYKHGYVGMDNDEDMRNGNSHLLIRDVVPLGLLQVCDTPAIQLILSTQPKLSPFFQVLAFDMTQCAVWIDDVYCDSDSNITIKICAPCQAWMSATLEFRGSCIREPFCPKEERLIKYVNRGYTISMNCDKLSDALRDEWTRCRSLVPKRTPVFHICQNIQ